MSQPNLSQSPVPFVSPANANGFNAHRQMPDVPRFLYHGTSSVRLALIREKGLVPRVVSENGWEVHPDAVYLSCSVAYAGALIHSIQGSAYDLNPAAATNTSSLPLVLQIDTEKLDPTRLIPDEDFLSSWMWENGVGDWPAEMDSPAIGRDEKMEIGLCYARSQMTKYASLWRESVKQRLFHSCAHLGAVSPDAISAYLIGEEMDDEFCHHLRRNYRADLAAHSATFDEMFERRGQPFHVEEMAANGQPSRRRADSN